VNAHDHDLRLIGAGPGRPSSAVLALKLGKKVAVDG
jgi:hypothetical protein